MKSLRVYRGTMSNERRQEKKGGREADLRLVVGEELGGAGGERLIRVTSQETGSHEHSGVPN
ncbi:hypothetical protein WG66_005399 [Moniliophthora roreri]|nr:hypothetical protein WG66_005399 [Moniliophthora roreri]